MALALGANAAGAAEIATLEALREGDMKKLVFHSEAKPVSQIAFEDPEGGAHSLGDWSGKHVLVNFWATWCGPCRVEMPMLDALQQEFGGDSFEVVTIATSRSALPGVEKFFEEAEIEALPMFLDPNQDLARDMGVLGLPITLLLNPEGEEIARLRGDADWSGASARNIVSEILAD